MPLDLFLLLNYLKWSRPLLAFLCSSLEYHLLLPFQRLRSIFNWVILLQTRESLQRGHFKQVLMELWLEFVFHLFNILDLLILFTQIPQIIFWKVIFADGFRGRIQVKIPVIWIWLLSARGFLTNKRILAHQIVVFFKRGDNFVWSFNWRLLWRNLKSISTRLKTNRRRFSWPKSEHWILNF